MNREPCTLFFLLCSAITGMFSNHSVSLHAFQMTKLLAAANNKKEEMIQSKVGSCQERSYQNRDDNDRNGHVPGLLEGGPCHLMAEFIVCFQDETTNAIAANTSNNWGAFIFAAWGRFALRLLLFPHFACRYSGAFC